MAKAMREAAAKKVELSKEAELKKQQIAKDEEREHKKELLKAEMRKTADDAVKEIMEIKKKKEEEKEAKEKKKAKFEEFLHKRKVKREWKDMQETLLK